MSRIRQTPIPRRGVVVHKFDGSLDYVTNSTAYKLVADGKYERLTLDAIRELPRTLQPKPIFPWEILESGYGLSDQVALAASTAKEIVSSKPGLPVWQMLT